MALKRSRSCHSSGGITTSFSWITGCLSGINCIICGVRAVPEAVFLVCTFPGLLFKGEQTSFCHVCFAVKIPVMAVSFNSTEPQSTECVSVKPQVKSNIPIKQVDRAALRACTANSLSCRIMPTTHFPLPVSGFIVCQCLPAKSAFHSSCASCYRYSTCYN